MPAGILRTAELAGTPVMIVCGRAEATVEGALVISLVDRFGVDAALGDARGSVELVSGELAARAAELVARGAPA